MSDTGRAALIWVPWLLLVGVAARVATWDLPLSYDAAIYLTTGGMVYDGATPYVDTCCSHGPANYVLFGFVDQFAGTSERAVRSTTLVAVVAASVMVGLYVRRLAGSRWGLATATLLVVLSGAVAFDGHQPNTEHYVLPVLAAAWLASTRQAVCSAALAGALLAVASLVNPPFAVVLPVLVVESWRAGSVRRRSRLAAICVAAGGVVVLAILTLAALEAVDDLWKQMWSYTASGTALSSGPGHPAGEPKGELPAFGTWVAAALGGLLAFRVPRYRTAAIASALWLGLMVLRVEVSSYSFPHHYVPAVPALAVLLALGGASLVGRSLSRLVAQTALVVLMWVYVIDPQLAAVRQAPTLRFGLTPENQYVLAEPVGRFVARHTDPDDSIFVGGGLFPQRPGGPPYADLAGEPPVYWYAKRRPATRYFTSFFRGRQPPGYEEERAASVTARTPAAIVVMPGVILPAFASRLVRKGGYVLAYDHAGAKVWLRRQARAAGESGRRT